MSLRTRIILLFLALAILPMLILAGFGYWQASELLLDAAHSRLNQTTASVVEMLRLRGLEIDEALNQMASSPLLREEGPDAGDATGGEAVLPPALQDAEYVRIQRPDGSSSTFAGAVPPEDLRSGSQRDSTLVVFSSSLPEELGSGLLTAAFRPDALAPEESLNRGSSIAVLDLSSRRVLVQRGDGSSQGPVDVESLLALPEVSGLSGDSVKEFRFRGEDGLRLGAAALVPGRSWAILATSRSGTVLSPLQRLVGSYWAFVIGLAGFTGLAFSILIGRFTRSLSDLAAAAEQIGTGDLSPWLPLPTSGEIGQLTTGFSRMLNQIREMMRQVDTSGRLAVVGQLSAYFAHEIRNPLTSVKLNLQRMDRWARHGKLPDFCVEPIEISLREVERLSASVSDVLQLSRSEETSPEPFSLHDLVAESAHLLQTRFERQGVELSLDLEAAADRVLARPGQIKSIVLNLMINALEAQPEGGFLEVRSELMRSRDFGGPLVAVRFRDGGPGVSPEIRDRVFEPFFTTKTNGSGIGLAVASRAVAENHGRLYLESSFMDGSGAEFVMAFPLAPMAAEGVGDEARFAPGIPEWMGLDWLRNPPAGPAADGTIENGPTVRSDDGGKATLELPQRKPEERN